MAYSRRRMNKYGRYAASAAYNYLSSKVRSRYWKSRTRTATNKKKSRFLGGVTNQYDVKTIYRKRRMPGRKRRQWVKAVKKHQAIATKSVGTRTALKNGTLAGSFTGSGQFVCSAAMYGLNGAADWGINQGYKDLFDILSGDTTGEMDARNEKCIFTSSVLDLTFHNTGDTKLEVDIYHIRVRDGTVTNRLEDTIGEALVGTSNNGTGASPSLGTRGFTPFEATVASQRGLKIYRKIKHFVGVGEVFTHQLKDPRNHVLNGPKLWNSNVFNEGVYNWQGKTQMLMFIVKSVPGTGAEANSAFSIGITRVYRWKVLESNEDFIGTY